MHSLEINQITAQQIKEQGKIETDELKRLVRHWFPGGWALCYHLQRMKDRPARSSIIQVVGSKAVREVYRMMCSDAFRATAELHFEMRFVIEQEDVFAAYDRFDMPTREFGLRKKQTQLKASATADHWAKAHPKGAILIRDALAPLKGGKSFVDADCSDAPDDVRKEAEILLAIDAARAAFESQAEAKLVFQLPCRIFAARAPHENRLMPFANPVSQIATIAIHPPG